MTPKGVAAVLDKVNGKFELKEYTLPTPAPGTMLIKQELAGVCGTDIHMFHGRLPGIGYPIILGHEFVGTVVSMGEGVTTDYLGVPLKEGDRVLVAPGVGCGQCYWCVVAKTPTTCEKGFAYGFFPHGEENYFAGGFAEYVYLHHPRSYVLKTDLPTDVAVLAEPMSVAVHAVTRAHIKPGDTVVIQGSGAVGLFTQIAARLAGAAKIIHVGGPTETRVANAKKFGADIVINIAEHKSAEERLELVKTNTVKGIGADVVFECTGALGAVVEGLNMTRTSGTFVEVGHFTDAGEVAINPFVHLCNKNITIQGSWGGEIEGFVRGHAVMERREFPYEDLVTPRAPFERLGEIMEVPKNGYILDGKETVKIVVSKDGK